MLKKLLALLAPHEHQRAGVLIAKDTIFMSIR
jgi:hypothetical protein